MVERYSPDVHYGRLLDTAEVVLRGPESVKIDIDYWGYPNLALQSETMPKIEGVIESRILYANPCDEEQKNAAILRHASWDAHSVRQSVLQDFCGEQEPSIACPVLSIRFVWIDMNWLYGAIQRLEKLAVPLQVPKFVPESRKVYKLKIKRTDGTSIKVSWRKEMPGSFQVLSEVWELLWQQLTDFLQSGEPVKPDELWLSGSAPVYRQTEESHD